MNDFEKKCKIEQNEELGRYVVAGVDIKAGETILLESPILIAPWNGERRCANCFKLSESYCSVCKAFPLCEECKQHNAYDCDLLAGMGDLRVEELQRYGEVYGPLKCLLMRQNPDTVKYYEEVLQLEAHLAERRNTDRWREHNEKVVVTILGSGVTQQLRHGSAIDEELLQHLCGLMDVNCFEIRGPDTGAMSGIYLRGLLLAHSCVPNTLVAIDDQYQMKIYANRDIAAGERIYNSYTNILLGTDERRQILKTSKYFDCKCVRCEDPTELGSHLSSFLCNPCLAKKQPGFVVRQADGKWRCSLCGHTLPPEHVAKVLERAKEEIFHAKDDIYRYEMLLVRLGRILHTNHYLMIDLKQNIAAILRAIIQNLAHRPGRKVYERKVRLCTEIVAALQILQPGLSRLRAIALYELFNTTAELGRLRFGENEISEAELMEELKKAERMLRESLRMLLYEPVGSPEGKLAKSMLRELKDLQNDMNLVQPDVGE